MKMGIRRKITLLLLLMLLVAIANLCVVFYYQGVQRHGSFVINAAGRQLRVTLASMLGFNALVFFVGYILSGRLVRPLKKLSRAAAEVGKGNFPKEMGISSSDEIGELGTAFGKMIADLESSRNTLISAKDYTDTILRSMIDPLIVVDFEGAIRAVNHAALNLLGYTEEELLGKPVGVVFKMKIDETPKRTRLQELMKEDFIRNFKSKSGERIPVGLYTSIMKDRTGKFLGYVCVARDMRQIHKLVVDLDNAKAELEVWSKTLEKKVEERTRELRQARDYTEKIIGSMNSILIVLDPELTIRTVNRYALELLGYEERDVLGRTINGFFFPTENAGKCSSNGIAGELAHNGGCMYNIQLAVQTRDGRGIPVLFSSSVMRDEHGVVQGIVCVARDISEYKRIMDKLARANAEIKSFAGIVSHDLRAPLVNLKGFSHELMMASREILEMLEDVAPLMAEGRRMRIRELLKHDIPESLDFINTSTTTMERLISHILTLSRIGSRSLNLAEINTGELVRNRLKMFQYQIESKNIRVSVKELPTVVADEIALDQIFGNVLSNAINYLDPGRPGEIEISGERRKNETLFVIKDNGRGIAEEDRHKVFEFFRRGRHAYAVSGEGMGLPYVKALLERHGGDIWFESTEGIGTAFYFTVGTEAPCGNSEEKSTFG